MFCFDDKERPLNSRQTLLSIMAPKQQLDYSFADEVFRDPMITSSLAVMAGLLHVVLQKNMPSLTQHKENILSNIPDN